MSFDGEGCIKLVRDKSTNEADLVAAIESLMHFPTQEACDALFDVVVDDTHDNHIREEAAGSLGTLWIEMGVDYTRLRQVPEQFLGELTADFSGAGIRLDSP